MNKFKNIYYGWWVVATCTMIALCGGAIMFSFTAFLKPIADELLWSYLAISFVMSLRNVEMGLASPVLGILIDRMNPGKLVLVGILTCAVGFVLLSQTYSLAAFFTAFIIISAGLTAFAQVVVTKVIATWFRGSELGYATGIAISGYPTGSVFLPAIAFMITAYGWRISSLILAGATLCIILVCSLILWRDPGQGNVQKIDVGSSPKTVEKGLHIEASDKSIDLRQAMKTKFFWIMSLVFICQMFAYQSLILHIMPFCISVNIPNNVAALIAMILALSSIVGRLGTGWIIKYISYRHIFIINIYMMSFSFFALYLGQSVWCFAAAIVLFGPAFGCSQVLRAVAVREYFGLKSFGSIQGMLLGIMTIGGIVGPSYVGYIFDIKGSYDLAWLSVALSLMIAAIVIAVATRNFIQGNN
jgi:sugar phosphate permease